jgi:hypothetical protein
VHTSPERLAENKEYKYFHQRLVCGCTIYFLSLKVILLLSLHNPPMLSPHSFSPLKSSERERAVSTVPSN